MATLASVLIKDIFANRPAAGVDGRMFFSTDTRQIFRDNGAGWDLVFSSSTPAVSLNAVAPADPGPYVFSMAHGLAEVPSRISILMTSPGGIWQQAAPDATHVYLAASGGGITALIFVFV
jgi:hypothetical protein